MGPTSAARAVQAHHVEGLSCRTASFPAQSHTTPFFAVRGLALQQLFYKTYIYSSMERLRGTTHTPTLTHTHIPSCPAAHYSNQAPGGPAQGVLVDWGGEGAHSQARQSLRHLCVLAGAPPRLHIHPHKAVTMHPLRLALGSDSEPPNGCTDCRCTSSSPEPVFHPLGHIPSRHRQRLPRRPADLRP